MTMKTLFRISSKQALFVTAIATFAFSFFFLQNNIVQGKGAALKVASFGFPAVADAIDSKGNGAYTPQPATLPPGTKPLAGAKIILTYPTLPNGSISTTVGADGGFSFPKLGKDNGAVYILTVAPLVTYNVSDSKSGPKETTVRTPVQVSVTFNPPAHGEVVAILGHTGTLGPISFMSSDSLQMKVVSAALSGFIGK
jgi:hypothetical protein